MQGATLAARHVTSTVAGLVSGGKHVVHPRKVFRCILCFSFKVKMHLVLIKLLAFCPRHMCHFISLFVREADWLRKRRLAGLMNWISAFEIRAVQPFPSLLTHSHSGRAA